MAGGVKAFAKGSVIVREGDQAAKEMYILLQGSVGLYKNYGLNNQVQVDVVSQGSFSGEMSLFLDKAPEHTLVALTDALVLIIGSGGVGDFFTGQPDMAVSIVKRICKRLDEATVLLSKYQSQADRPSVSQKSSLFPKGHGKYLLELPNHNEEMIYQQRTECPLCGHVFESLMVLTTKLRILRTDPDLRVRYKDVDPIYYDVLTCPNCYLSAPREEFGQIAKTWAEEVNRAVGPYKLEMYIASGRERDTFTVFAGYYLAILCAAVCFDDYQLIRAGLWQKVSRLYQDCGDDAMRLYASEEALADYLYAYEHFRMSDKQSQQLCYIIGDLYTRKGDLDNGRNYFFLAKSNRAGTAVLSRQADNRLEEIREMKKKEQGQA